MLKKRIIFTLLYEDGYFMHSRNFRLQRVGDLGWLRKNYNFADVAFFVDELIVLDVSRRERDIDAFCKVLEEISIGCFVPIAAGGGISHINHANRLLRSGADKVVLNTAIVDNPGLVHEITTEFGQQCVVASIDFHRDKHGLYQFYTHNGSLKRSESAQEILGFCLDRLVGEIYLTNIEKDGTGQGYDLDILNSLPAKFDVPIILSGGVGNAQHLLQGLLDPRVDAVSTANLFNFMGDGLKNARSLISESYNKLAKWQSLNIIKKFTQ